MTPSPSTVKTILVVDDQAGVRRLLRRLLELDSYAVVDFGDGERALAALDEMPDLACALLDLTMPSMDGLTLARALHKSRPSLPIVFMSGYDRNQVLQSNSVASAELTFLAKPFTRQSLRATINAVSSQV